MPKYLFNIIAVLCLALMHNSYANKDTVETLQIAPFSRMSLTDITPPGWQALNFNSIESTTAYFLTNTHGINSVQAVSHASASAYFKKVDISPHDYPIIKWQWRITNIINKGDVTRKDGDDYPARIYISFDYDPERLSGMERVKYKLYRLVHDKAPPLAVINYIWGNKTPVGTNINNAYSDRVKMFVIQSGNNNVGKWITEKRNVLEDYRRAFGEEPGNITGIAIMTDTDNTGESATAWYGDITLSK